MSGTALLVIAGVWALLTVPIGLFVGRMMSLGDRLWLGDERDRPRPPRSRSGE